MTDQRLIYLDHAATTFPRPPEVLDRMRDRYERMGCSPGRGGYDLAMEAGALVDDARKKTAAFFGAPDPNRVVFAANATDALNLAIFGLIPARGGHVVSSRLEHNSVLRPLHHLRQTGRADFTLVGFDPAGFIDPDDVSRAIRPDTSLVVINHASNVLGSVQPAAEIGRVCRDRGVPLVIDTAQSAGHAAVDLTAWHVSAVVFTGHKGLLGPTGIGGLVTAPDLDVASTRFGGTGFDSDNPDQPRSFPHRLEAGTLNLLGVMGLAAGLDYLEKLDPAAEHRRQMELAGRLHRRLAEIDRVTVYGTMSPDRHVPVISFNIHGVHPHDAGTILDGDHDVAARTGLHCAPLVHRDLGTAPDGSIRFSLGWNTTAIDVDRAADAVARTAARGKS